MVTEKRIAQQIREKFLVFMASEMERDKPKKGEGTGQGKLGGMGMIGKWIEVGAHLGIGEILIVDSPLSACWDN